MDKEEVLKPLERLITLLNNTPYESEALKIKQEINELWKKRSFNFMQIIFGNNHAM